MAKEKSVWVYTKVNNKTVWTKIQQDTDTTPPTSGTQTVDITFDDTDTATPDDIDSALNVQPETYEEMDADDTAMADAMTDNYTAAQEKSRIKYMSQSHKIADGGDGHNYSLSQVMNHKINTGHMNKFTTMEQHVFNNLQAAAQPITKNLSMIRAGHADILQRLGIQDYTQLSGAQLQAKLVGLHYTEKAFQSMSWNESANPFIHGASAGGREVFVKISAPKGMKVAVGDKSEAEFIGMPGQGYTIKNVYYDGTYAFPKATMTLTPRVVIEVVADV